MKGFVLIVFVSLLLAAPTGVSPPSGNGGGDGQGGPEANPGLERACDVANSPQPCEHLGLVTDLDVETGENDTYQNGTWTVDETITVHTGGVLTLDMATFRFTGESGGIVVHPGGVLRIYDSTLEPRDGSSAYVLDLDDGASFTLNESTVRGGEGVKLRTSDADVSGNLLTEIPLALHMIDVVEVTIHHNHFLDNNVSVNQTGGVTTLDANYFEGGETCVRDWLADPTITNNVFRGCHTGIWHERSNSRFELNDMEDQMNPPGTGIVVMDTNSPIIEDNSIRNYGTGILVVNATAYIRNNTIADNVGDGVRVVGNTQPMDIQGNLITGNGGDGVHLIDAFEVTLANNTVTANDGSGVVLEDVDGATFFQDVASDNGGDGFRFQDSEADATNATANGNGGSGVRLVGSTISTILGTNASANVGDGYTVNASGSITIQRARAIGNGADGLRNAGHDIDTFGGWFEGNADAGVRNVATATLPAECSYWGDPSGPTAPDNPGGTGDEAVGNIDYFPYATAPEATCTAPIFVAVDG